MAQPTKMDGLGAHFCHLIFIYVNFFAIIVTVAMAIMANGNDPTGIFNNSSIPEVWQGFDTDLTPPVWTFYTWYVVFIWAILWSIYTITQTCRQGISGQLYYSPTLFPYYFYLVFMVSLAFVILWVFLFVSKEIIPAFVCCILIVITINICLIICFIHLKKERANLIRNGFLHEPGMSVGFVHNGIGMYAVWMSYLTFIQLVMMLHYSFGTHIGNATTVALVIFTCVYLIWVSMELIFLDAYTRWFVIPYIALAWILIGVCVKNYETANDTNAIFMLVLLVVACLCLVIKFIVAIYRECTQTGVGGVSRGRESRDTAHDNTYQTVISKTHGREARPSYQHKIYMTTDSNRYRY